MSYIIQSKEGGERLQNYNKLKVIEKISLAFKRFNPIT